ncbi:unnamed protein product, partial [Polarella glacialis]
ALLLAASRRICRVSPLPGHWCRTLTCSAQGQLLGETQRLWPRATRACGLEAWPLALLNPPALPPVSGSVAAAAAVVEQTVTETIASASAAASAVSELFGGWADFLRPRRFSMRLDVKMKRGAAPYPRNPNRKKPIPKVQGIIRKFLD